MMSMFGGNEIVLFCSGLKFMFMWFDGLMLIVCVVVIVVSRFVSWWCVVNGSSSLMRSSCVCMTVCGGSKDFSIMLLVGLNVMMLI